jgi:hypothetical protein
MGIFDAVLGSVSGHADIANLATKLGIPPNVAEKAIAALAVEHQQPGDTIAGAAAKTGLDSGTLGLIVQQIGGEGSLGEFARTLQEHPEAANFLSKLDRDGDGSVIDDVVGIAKGLFGKS